MTPRPTVSEFRAALHRIDVPAVAPDLPAAVRAGHRRRTVRRAGAAALCAVALVLGGVAVAPHVGLTAGPAPTPLGPGPDPVLRDAQPRTVNGNPGLDTGLRVQGKHLLLDCYPCTGGKLGVVEVAAEIPDHHKGVDSDHHSAPHGPYVAGSSVFYREATPASGRWTQAAVRDRHDRPTGEYVVYATLPRGGDAPVAHTRTGPVRMAVTPAPWDRHRLLAVTVVDHVTRPPADQVTYADRHGRSHPLPVNRD